MPRVPARLLCFLLLLPAVLAARAADEGLAVVVADPYVELHSGPGRGYPVLEVVERGYALTVLERRTTWFRVRTQRDTEGWAARAQLERTLLPEGTPFEVQDTTGEDLRRHRVEVGALAGQFDGAPLLGLYGSWRYTPNLSAEIAAGQAVGRLADNLLVDVSLAQHPFPDWRVSPYFALGAGYIQTRPASTLVAAGDTSDQTLGVAVGAQAWLSQAFVFRVEYRQYLLLAGKNDNGDADTWKAGLAVFF